ncbi:MAG: response regulator transcription factor [Bacteroidales bacterium]
MRVILADDSGLILERLEEMISLNKQVEIIGSYKNGKDTLQALRNLKPDLAIVDLKMPGLSGLQVLTEIRHEDKALKFIILTFCASEYYRQLAFNVGADYFFSKVEDFEKVSLVLNEMVLQEIN